MSPFDTMKKAVATIAILFSATLCRVAPGAIEDNGDIRTWTDRGTDPGMGGTKPGDCPARFYKLAAYR